MKARSVRFSIPLAVVFWAASLHAAPPNVEVTVTGPATPEERSALLIAEPVVVGDALPSLQRPIDVPGSARLDLAPGHAWRLRLDAPGLWASEEVVVPVAGEPAPVRMNLLPTASVVGSLAVQRGESLPTGLDVRFEASDRSAAPIPRTSRPCEVVESTFRCEVPAGRLDLRLRSKGFVSHYLWGQTVTPDKRLDLGRLALRRGASVVGRVEIDGRAEENDQPLITLAPTIAGSRGPRPDPRAESRNRTQTVDERGFFHFEGLPAGQFVLRAELDGFAPVSHGVYTVENAESSLDNPLILRPPIPLSVFVDPAFDPSGAPWLLELSFVGDEPGHLASVGRGEPVSSDAGAWVIEDLVPGQYILRLLDSKGTGFAMQRTELVGDDPPLYFDLDHVEVEGRLLLGDEPLGATLSFGGAHGMVRVVASSDPEGRFSTLLPRAGAWRVDIQSDDPRMYRRLAEVEVKSPRNGRSSLEIRLPDGRIAGEVVREDGGSVENAVVDVTLTTGEEIPSHVVVDSLGGFELAGFEAGLYVVTARMGDAASDPIFVRVSDGDTARVLLPLRARARLAGVVRGASGGVPFTRIEARPVLGPGHAIDVWSTTTDVTGAFELLLPAWVREVELTAFPPGYALRHLRVQVPAESDDVPAQPIVVEVAQNGGTLDLRFAGGRKSDDRSTLPPILFSPGGELHVRKLAEWARSAGAPPASASGLRVPRMEPGGYALCWFEDLAEYSLAAATRRFPEARCARAALAPFGEASLTVRPPR